MISLAVFVIYGASLAVTRAAGGSDVSNNVTIQILLLVALFAAIPFITGSRRMAFAVVDRLLYKEIVDHPDLTRRISIDAAHARHVDDLAGNVLGTIARELQLSFAAFVDVTDGRANVKASAGTMPDGLMGTLSSQSTPIKGETELPSELAVPDTDSSAIAVALSKEESGAWVLCLGPKVTEEPFETADLALAQSVVGHIATIVEKLDLLVEELKTKAGELRELNRRLVETQELERGRIAGYPHDEPLQEITNLVWRYSDSGLPPSIQDDLQGIASGLRNFAANLHPGVLEDLDLVRALEWLGSEASIASDFEFVFQTEPSNGSRRLDREIELALYRIAQEALTNCQRHSKAKTVWLRLSSNGSRATLVVEDDGVGLAPAESSRTVARLGLIGMRERAEQLGGYLRAASRSPSGTRVEASIPIDTEGRLQLRPRVLRHD